MKRGIYAADRLKGEAVGVGKDRMKLFKIAALLLGLVIFFYLQNNWIQMTRLEVELKRLPRAFNGFRIVHLSDLHGKVFGSGSHSLVSKVWSANPDMIVITGDFIDAGYFSEPKMLNLLGKLQEAAPVYYVTGNHEVHSEEFPKLEQRINKTGITILRNSFVYFQQKGESVVLMGIDDPTAWEREHGSSEKAKASKRLESLRKESRGFTILLTHRPELFDLYAQYDIDLAFSGHAHGGQFRLPFIGGLAAPGQGLFPQYTSGMYHKENSVMIVSRGLGNSSFPLRLFNRPEIVVTTLTRS